jgi:hypothetical protein
MDIVINRCFGGFGLSEAAGKRYGELTGKIVIPPYDRHRDDSQYFTEDGKYKPGVVYCGNMARNDPALVQVVRELGKLANTRFSELAVVTIPDGVDWEISDYDGVETIQEAHRSWS